MPFKNDKKYQVTFTGNFDSIAHAKSLFNHVANRNGSEWKLVSVKRSPTKLLPQKRVRRRAKPNGFVFLRGDFHDDNQFYVTPLSYWNEKGFISDSQQINNPCKEFLPKGFYFNGSGSIAYNGKDKKPDKLLRQAGFREVVWGEKVKG